MARFIGSSGSRGSRSSVVAQPPASASSSGSMRKGRLSARASVTSSRPSFGCLVEKELADQVLQHYRRLGQAHPVAVLQHHAVAPGLQADVLLAEDAGG